ncbi:BEN domain-containing protein 2-like [Brienomyrus brachyistius]|uniref:BEN domain-containing protein 2-like n=1 Tax=Brienomyrus brachyistius TaxID=42636 RepID=UPI0020B32B9D|nr:BEN domain-containing protein 2-like [Brienomyrus brachyistius]
MNGQEQPSSPDFSKPYSLQLACEDTSNDPTDPLPVTETVQDGQEVEEQHYSPSTKAWRRSGTHSMGSEGQEECLAEDTPSVGMEYDAQLQFEQAAGSSEDLYSIDQQITLGEILTYCQVMYEAIQKLDQKFDQLQAKVTSIQTVHLSPGLFSQKAQMLSSTGVPVHQFRMDGCTITDSGLPMPQLVRVGSPPPSVQGESKKPPPLSPAPGVPSPPRLAPQARKGLQVESTAAVGPREGPPAANTDTVETPKKASTPIAGSAPKTARKSPPGANPGKHKTVWLGDPRRKVRIPSSALQKAVGAMSPRSAVRLLLRSLFPVETLTSSNIMGDSVRGLKKLDPNKIAAMREWVAKKFPTFDLKENGRDWKACVSIMNSTARYLRFEAKKQRKPKVQCDTGSDPVATAEPDPPAVNPAAEIDVELSDGEGDGPIRSRKASASVPQQRAPESSSKPSLGGGETTSDDTLEYLGSPSRQVKVPQVAMSTARLRSRPELVARFLIKYLFPEHVLVRSNVYGNREHGIQALDRNKISALREHLKDRFPWMLLEENGQDWKVCVGAINSTIRKFRHDLKKGKTRKKGR